MKKKLSLKTMIRMIVEWDEFNEVNRLEEWWQKYPTYSRKDIIRMLRKWLRQKPKNHK